MYKRLIVSLVIFSIVIVSCNSQKDKTVVLKELAGIDSIQRKAHYEKDAVLLGSIMRDSFYVASNGKISLSTKEKMVKSFSDYFKELTYSYWENVDPPIVEFDGDIAVVTYHKKTISTMQDSAAIDTATFAWASVFKNIDGAWKITGIITTDDQ